PVKTDSYIRKGIHSIRDLPESQKLPDAARRQLNALRTGKMVVEASLGNTLREELGDARLGYLDFETINRAVPVWDGLGPWRAAVVQFSYHEQVPGTGGQGPGAYAHRAYLAEGPHDPRPELAARMLEATRNA